MSDQFMIYGATGYTGQLIARLAVTQGLRPLLGGRSASALAALAGELGLDYRIAPLTDAAFASSPSAGPVVEMGMSAGDAGMIEVPAMR